MYAASILCGCREQPRRGRSFAVVVGVFGENGREATGGNQIAKMRAVFRRAFQTQRAKRGVTGGGFFGRFSVHLRQISVPQVVVVVARPTVLSGAVGA